MSGALPEPAGSSWHGIGHPPQPNPLRVVVSRASLLFHPLCCGWPYVITRAGVPVEAAHRIGCWWEAITR